MPTKGRQAGDDSIADLDGADFTATGFDDPCGFMAGNCWEPTRIGTVDEG